MLTDSLQTDALQPQALDYDSLRRQGIAWLEKLAGTEWTDFNAHDPGITILEQVCYALTDLVYRINYDIEDLLSRDGEQTYDSLYGPDRILVTKPVTLLDLRKWIIDVEGVKNAWIEPATASQPALFYIENPTLQAGVKQIALTGDDGAAGLNLQGLYRVLIEKSEAVDKDGNAIVRDVAERLHDQRGLAIDFESVDVIDTQDVQIQAHVEIDLAADPDDVYLAILEKIAAYLSPTVRFYTLEQRLAQGKTIDEIFDGPLLDHGFIDDRELLGLKRKKNLYVSDLVREIMDVSGVRMVESVFFKDGAKFYDTALVLDANKSPKLNIFNCKLTLKKRQLPVRLNTEELSRRYAEKQKNTVQRTRVSSDVPTRQGRDRRIARYYSLLRQFPRIYGIGDDGLPASASDERKAQAKQLKAYLLFFDQLIANNFAQLAHVKDLFSFDYAQPDTYFAASLDAPGADELWMEPKDGADRDLWLENKEAFHRQRMQQIFGASQPGESGISVDWPRKNRFLDHLLARFAEQFTDYSHFRGSTGTVRDLHLSKLALLRAYPQISSSKGTGFNALAEAGPDNCSGLERMLRLKFGFLDNGPDKLYVVEHALLRPMSGDLLQQGPVLNNAGVRDPYSLQLTVVLFVNADGEDFKRFAEQTIREETPAHLVVYVRWLASDDEAGRFDKIHQNWQQQQSAYRMKTDRRILNGDTGQSAAIPLRDARDRLIDWLALGQTYPLRDLAIDDVGTVAYNMKARIVIQNSQQGVSYLLCDDKQQPLKPEIKQDGNGGALELITPAIVDDRCFSIKAIKAASGLSAFLLQTPTVKVGLDLALIASIQNAELLAPNPEPAADDDRIVDYGVKVQVAVEKAQEGVDYKLVDGKTAADLSAVVRGTSKTILLETKNAVTEDVDIRIRATKTFDKSENKATQTDLLAAVLPLKVRANPALTILIPTPVIDYADTATIDIEASQASTGYQVLARGVADHEFVRGVSAGSVLTVALPDQQPSVVLAMPAIEGFAAVSNVQPGNGGKLSLTGANLKDDSFIAVQAVKEHRAKTGVTVTSIVQLAQVNAVLVRPDANPPLRFKAAVADSLLQAPIQVSGGQAGVFYEFTTAADGKVQGLPVYFHQLDRVDNSQNKGVGQLQIGVDLAVAPNLLPATTSSNPNRAKLPPEPPELNASAAIAGDAKLSVRAIKAQTRLEAQFKRAVSKLLA